MNSIDRFKKSYYINKYKKGGTVEDQNDKTKKKFNNSDNSLKNYQRTDDGFGIIIPDSVRYNDPGFKAQDPWKGKDYDPYFNPDKWKQRKEEKEPEKFQEGGETDNEEYGLRDVALDMAPVVGTVRSFNRFREDPDFDTGAELVISGLSDALLPFGIGGIVRAARFAKAAKAAKNMRKLYQYDKARRNADLGLATADIVAVPLTKTFVVPWDRYFREDDME